MTNLLLYGGYFEYYMMGILLIPGLILAIYAQIKVNHAVHNYSQIPASCGKTGAEVARLLLDSAGLHDITIKRVKGNMTDYYDPKNKVLALSNTTHDSTSVAALGIATHEVGHALQYKAGYFPIKLRNIAIPLANFASVIMWPLAIIGLILSFVVLSDTLIGNIFLWAGIASFGLAVIVNLVTLPVEFNASKRATQILHDSHLLQGDENKYAKEVLDAAALTYVASLVIAILDLLRFILVFADRE